MAIPDFQTLMLPLLRISSEAEVSLSEATERLSTEFHLTDEERNALLPSKRQTIIKNRVEVEHIVPAENFGRSFAEWREGAPQCVNAKTGKPYKGRKCAETNPEFQRMEADLHNLAPAIGAVNAARKNYRFGMVPEGIQSAFGESCNFKIHGRTVEPPDSVKGLVARTHLYMAATYPKRFRLSRQQQQLFEAWNKMFAPDSWECEREKRIARVQGNRNRFTVEKCED